MTARRAFILYAVALAVIGAMWRWRAPLTWDEQQYYEPAARYFAERLPSIPLDYPMPMPPFALVVQGIVYRLTGSVAMLRMLSTAAAIAAAAVVASLLRTTSSRAAGWLVLMFGTLPPAMVNAFTLKHHAFALLCCAGAFALWEKRRVFLVALVLAAGALTHQIAIAAIGTLVVLALLERRFRDAAIVALSALPLAALVLLWGGARPPLYDAAFPSEPHVAGLHPQQLLVLLFMAGAWIAPAVGVRVRVAAAALPFTAIAMYATRLLQPVSASVYDRIAGPLASAIAAGVSGNAILAAGLGGALAALGIATCVTTAVGSRMFRIWSAMYAMAMLAVPYFFESYYALFVAVSWLLLREHLALRREWFPILATSAGVAYFVLRAASG